MLVKTTVTVPVWTVPSLSNVVDRKNNLYNVSAAFAVTA
jgi:hypothetical protein